MAIESLGQQTEGSKQPKQAKKIKRALLAAAVIVAVGVLVVAVGVLTRSELLASVVDVPPLMQFQPRTGANLGCYDHCVLVADDEPTGCAVGLKCIEDPSGWVGTSPGYCYASTCGSPIPSPAPGDCTEPQCGADVLSSGGITCSCMGSTLQCESQNGQPAVIVHESSFCNSSVQDLGDCYCNGSDLACEVSVCTFTGFHSIVGSGGRLWEYWEVAGLCNPDTLVNASGEQGTRVWTEDYVNGAVSTIVFPNHASCAPPPTIEIEIPASTQIPMPSVGIDTTPVGVLPDPDQNGACANNGGIQYQGTTCVCPGVVDNVTICNDGTTLDQVSNVPCSDAQNCGSQGSTGGGSSSSGDGGSVECGCGLYGAPYGGLGCSDGTITECVEACGCKP